LYGVDVFTPAIVTIIAWKFPNETIEFWIVKWDTSSAIAAACLIFLAAAIVKLFTKIFHKPQRLAIENIFAVQGRNFWNKNIVDVETPRWGNNITLYQLQKRPWWFFGLDVFKRCHTRHLVPRLRYPASGKRPDRSYGVVLNNGKCEGFPGRIFGESEDKHIKSLPDVSSLSSPKADKKKYARETGNTLEMIRERKPTARSLLGMILVLPNGYRWGVIVIESKDEAGIDESCMDDPEDTRIETFVDSIISHLNGR